MENILIVFLNNLKDIEGFNKIIDEFDKRGYKMYLYNDIKDTDFDFTELPDVIEYYKKQHRDANKVVILSNMRDLIFAWYRCYNSIVDDFVYFIDEEENNYFDVNDRHFGFYQALFEFANINDEKIEDKIYININFDNYTRIIEYMFKDNDFSRFDSIDNLSYTKKTNKEIIIKEYVYKRYEYLFDFHCANSTRQTVRLNEVSRLKVGIDDNFIAQVVDNLYIIPFLTIYFYKEKNDDFTNILLTLFNKLKDMDKDNQAKVFVPLFDYVNRYCFDFKEKIYIASLLVLIHGKDEMLTEFIMKTVLEDEKYREFHYEVLVNVLFYIGHEGISLYKDFYLDKRNIVDKLSKWVMKKRKFIEKNKYKNSKRIAIVVEQLLSINHSPTKVMLDYAKNIIKYYPEYRVKIFVEDNFYCSNKEEAIAMLYSSSSEIFEKSHMGYLNNEAIEIYYCDLDKPKKNRTLDLIKEIVEFGPQAILTNSDISLSTNILYNHLPIIYMSMGGVDNYFCKKADIYLCTNREKTIQLNNKYNLLDEDRLYDFKWGLEFSKPTKVIERKDLNIKEDDFVMITVGNRLDEEMDEKFIDCIMNFVIQNNNVRWLVVGSKSINHLKKEYSSLIGNFGSKVILIEYERDLPALYRICDVYANPRRTGGGTSIAMAMHEGLPIVLTKDLADGANYVGQENCSGVDVKECIDDLKMLRSNKEYRKTKGELMRKTIEIFTFEKSIKSLFEIMLTKKIEKKL